MRDFHLACEMIRALARDVKTFDRLRLQVFELMLMNDDSDVLKARATSLFHEAEWLWQRLPDDLPWLVRTCL